MCSLPSVLESPPPRNPGSLAGQTREPESPACLPELTSRWSASPVWGAQVPGTREEVSRQPAPGSLFVAPHPHHRWLHHSPLSPRVTCVWTLLGALPCEPPASPGLVCGCPREGEHPLDRSTCWGCSLPPAGGTAPGACMQRAWAKCGSRARQMLGPKHPRRGP